MNYKLEDENKWTDNCPAIYFPWIPEFKMIHNWVHKENDIYECINCKSTMNYKVKEKIKNE